MKKYKRIFTTFLALCACMIFSFSAGAKNINGICGENLTWTFDTGAGVLKICGNGAMENYESDTEVPWYRYRSDITCVIVEKGVTSIGNSAFENCYYLQNITLPGSVESIGKSAFQNCFALTDISIPSGVKKIASHTFDGCGKLANVTIPDTVLTIGDYAFAYCDGLIGINIPFSVKTIGKGAFSFCEGIESIVIPDGVTTIGKQAFSNCYTLESVTIPTSITSVGKDAFSGCSSLTDVFYDGSVQDKKEISFSSNAELMSAMWHYAACVHQKVTEKTKATTSSDGSILIKCTVCGEESHSIICQIGTVYLSEKEYTYNGKVQTPTVVVKDREETILTEGTHYTVTYEKGRKAVGRYTVKVTFKGNYSGTKKLTYTIVPKVKGKISATSSTSSITLAWKKVTGADGYRVYQYNPETEKYEKIKTIFSPSTLTYKATGLNAGRKYKFKIKAFAKDEGTIWGKASSAFETATKTVTPKITNITTTSKQAVVNWKDVSGESGYVVYYSTKKDSGYKKYSSVSKNGTKKTVKNLKSGKTYYFKVRSYIKTDSGNVYSSWSSIKKIKVK